MDIAEAQEFIRHHHRGVLGTVRNDGGQQLTPVTVGLDAEGYAVISTRETAFKVHNLRRDPRATLCVFRDEFFGTWVFVEGEAQVVSLPDAMEPLVDYYRRIAGEHPDWADYRAAMERDRRCLLRIRIERAGPNVQG